MCNIHLDDATAAIVRQNAHHAPERRQSDEANQQIWGLIGGHDGQRPMGKFGQDAEVTPLLFLEGFLMITESQDLGLTSHPKDGAFYSTVSVPVTILGR